MSYPHLIEINNASRMQLVVWYRILPSALTRRDCLLKKAINRRILNKGPITQEETTSIGYPFSPHTLRLRKKQKIKKALAKKGKALKWE